MKQSDIHAEARHLVEAIRSAARRNGEPGSDSFVIGYLAAAVIVQAEGTQAQRRRSLENTQTVRRRYRSRN